VYPTQFSKKTVLLLPKLQSNFAEFLQLYSFNALVCSTYPPVLDLIYLLAAPQVSA